MKIYSRSDGGEYPIPVNQTDILYVPRDAHSMTSAAEDSPYGTYSTLEHPRAP